MKKFIITIILVLLITSCVAEKEAGKIIKKKVSLTTPDNVKIFGDFYPGPSIKGIILLPMFNSSRESWNEIIKDLQKEKYNILAIDPRGHGESTYNLSEPNEMVIDTKTAFEYLIANNIEQISIIGASIGANTALNFAIDEPRIQSIILISPGLDYQGVLTSSTIRDYNKPLLIIAGKKDVYAWESSRTLFNSSPSRVRLQGYETDAHGTNILKEIPESKQFIINWLKTN
ncbi:MAG: alpha/beta fold hydrolase [Nanoarchaeota archaeon]|nr:alpha/beta fold hydrolase [Nanoarchaeota archaeon]